jgi:hypothetical protein
MTFQKAGTENNGCPTKMNYFGLCNTDQNPHWISFRIRPQILNADPVSKEEKAARSKRKKKCSGSEFIQ